MIIFGFSANPEILESDSVKLLECYKQIIKKKLHYLLNSNILRLDNLPSAREWEDVNAQWYNL
jgi:hypothetical protein